MTEKVVAMVAMCQSFSRLGIIAHETTAMAGRIGPTAPPGIRSREAADLYTAEKPYHENNDQHGSKNPTETGASVTAMGVIAAAPPHNRIKITPTRISPMTNLSGGY
jgi:hypothetical protein